MKCTLGMCCAMGFALGVVPVLSGCQSDSPDGARAQRDVQSPMGYVPPPEADQRSPIQTGPPAVLATQPEPVIRMPESAATVPQSEPEPD